MNTKEEIKNKSSNIFNKNIGAVPNKKQIPGNDTKKLITKITKNLSKDKKNKKPNFNINEISFNIDEQIEIEKNEIDFAKQNNLLKNQNLKNNNNILDKINQLVQTWNERKFNFDLFNINEKNIYKLRPTTSHFFYLIYNKVNLIIKKLVKEKIDFNSLLNSLSPEARIWALSKIPSLKLPYYLKTQKLLVLINGLEKKNPIQNLFLLKKSSYRYIMDFPDLLESVFDKKINFHIYKLIKLIKISSDPNTLISNTKNNILEIRNGYKIYSSPTNNTCVLKKINLEIQESEFILLLGPSGSGKTTLMNCLSGIDQLSFGDIVANNNNITKLTDHSLTKFRMNNVAYIFQHYGLLPNLNVLENVMIGDFLRTKNYSWKDKNIKNYQDQQFIELLLKDFEIYNEKYKMIHELSGGQQQRTSIARAIAKKAKLIFADEPTSALDEKTGVSIIKFLKKACLEHNQTIIMITHDEKNIDYATRIIRLKDGEIVEDYKKG